MTFAALMLRDGLFQQNVSQRLRYGVVGVLFVNRVDWRHADALRRTSPVLMVAATWAGTWPHVFGHFGWKAALAVTTNAAVLTLLFSKAAAAAAARVAAPVGIGPRVPASIVAVQLLFPDGRGRVCAPPTGVPRPVPVLHGLRHGPRTTRIASSCARPCW